MVALDVKCVRGLHNSDRLIDVKKVAAVTPSGTGGTRLVRLGNHLLEEDGRAGARAGRACARLHFNLVRVAIEEEDTALLELGGNHGDV